MTRRVDEIRKRINAVDARLLSVIEERAELAKAIMEAKREEGHVSTYDPDRERRLLDAITEQSSGLLSPGAIRSIWREIISACRAVQRPLTVAYLGPSGTFSEVAARELFGDNAAYAQESTIDGVFRCVHDGRADRGVVPIENSSEGRVGPTVQALLHSTLQIERQHVIPIRYALCSHAARLADVARVYSHPQALGQCSAWLREQLPDAELVPRASTAAAADDVASDAQGAALLSARAASERGLTRLADGLSDDPSNATRFWVIGTEDSAPTGNDRTSISFDLPDRPGALKDALAAFEQSEVNLTHLASHASRRKAWAWTFMCELEGHRSSAQIQRAITELEALADRVRMLGSYPSV